MNISQTVHAIPNLFRSRQGFLGVGGSNGVISGSIISKMVADGHLGMTALSCITLASAGLSYFSLESRDRILLHSARAFYV